jgi:predicted dehydrogenase
MRKIEALVKDPSNIRLAMVGIVAENAHPYSWSAVINGYNPEHMASCPASVVPEYLNAQPRSRIGIEGVQVTHIWGDDLSSAEHVARASLVPHVVERPEDVIGKVDAVIIPTDIGSEHLERARPFIDADLPVFIDKPLTDREDHLRQFIQWQASGKAIASSSVMRYSPDFLALRERSREVGTIRLITMTMVKSWERYGIHAAEAVYRFLPAGGWDSVANTGTDRANIVHIHHSNDADVVLAVIEDLDGAFACMNVSGTNSTLSASFSDKFTPVKKQMESFVEYLRTGRPSFPFAETVELMKIVIAGTRSRNEGGRKVELSEILA